MNRKKNAKRNTMGLDLFNKEDGIRLGFYGAFYDKKAELILAALEYLGEKMTKAGI